MTYFSIQYITTFTNHNICTDIYLVIFIYLMICFYPHYDCLLISQQNIVVDKDQS